MPLLHRLATLRDDVIFFVYLYQSWKYKVDYSRVNEFGQGGDDEATEVKKAVEPLKADAGGDGSAVKAVEGGEKVEGNGKATGSEQAGGGRKRKA